MKETASQKFRLGLFTVLGTLVFVAAIYFIGNKQDLFGRTAELNAIFNDVNGLQPGNNVRYSGIDIGTVRHIEMVNDSAIKVEMAIDRKILPRIKTDAVATINSDGLVGSMIVNIIPGRGRKPSLQEGATIASYSRVRTDDMLKTLSVTNENAALLTRDLLKITNQITQGQGSVGVLLNDQQLAADIKETVRYLKISSQETAASMAQVNKLLASLDRKDNAIGVLKDTAVAGQLKRTVANLEQSSRAVNQTLGKLDAAVAEIKDGESAVNYLTKDPKSARQIDSMMTNINKAAILLQQDLEALKHNFLLRGYFKKQEKKAKKQP
ncbi:MCE family protein [Flavobacterium longum]|uniref:MlaD family protein n=1 Tax=Flavobacterium longum TaxID=1299340 RepID=UPI0039EC247D